MQFVGSKKVEFCWHVYGGAKTIEPVRYITETDLEKSSNRILFMSMFNDFGWETEVLKRSHCATHRKLLDVRDDVH